MSAETGLTEDENQELFKGLTETEKQELINLFEGLTSYDDEQVKKFTTKNFYELAYKKVEGEPVIKSEELNELVKELREGFTPSNKILSTTDLLSLFKEFENYDVLYEGLDQDNIDYLKLLLKRDFISFLKSLEGKGDYKFTLKERDIDNINNFLNVKTHTNNFSLNFLFEKLTFSIKVKLLKLIEELINNSFEDIYTGLNQNEIDDLKLLLKT